MEMFDEVIETHVEPDGKVEEKRRYVSDEETVAQMDAQEMENAVADLVRSFRDFNEIMSRGVNPTDPLRSLGWWRALEYLALAESRMKDCFCGRHRDPASIRQYAKFRSKLEGKRYRPDEVSSLRCCPNFTSIMDRSAFGRSRPCGGRYA